MKGKRVGAGRRTGRYLAKGPRRKQTKGKTGRKKTRIAVCGVIVVLLVAVKLLFPQAADNLVNSASRLLGRETDFREAFAAVGRVVSGEQGTDDSLQDAYAAVFSPSNPKVNAENNSEDEATAGEQEDLSEQNKQTEDTETAQTISGIYMMSSLPEDASLELRNFGFRYISPVNGTLTSAFGWREHPTEGGTRFHYGVDLAAEKGTEIVAFADGTVFATGESSTLGKYIILHHAGGYRTLYAHCSEILVLNGSVSMGQVIARVGDTGTVTGPHLHFELQDGSLYLNPIYYVSIW